MKRSVGVMPYQNAFESEHIPRETVRRVAHDARLATGRSDCRARVVSTLQQLLQVRETCRETRRTVQRGRDGLAASLAS